MGRGRGHREGEKGYTIDKIKVAGHRTEGEEMERKRAEKGR